MTVYVYDKQTNHKKETIKNAYNITSSDNRFLIDNEKGRFINEKDHNKLVVYGF